MFGGFDVAGNAIEAIQELVGAPEAEHTPTPMGFGGAYDGASRFDKSVALWSPPIQSADLDILPEKDLMDGRVQDMLRNDGYVHAGAQLHRDNIVGHAYFFNSKPNLVALGVADDETWQKEFQDEVEAKFTLAAESPECWFDVTRKNTLTSLVRLAIGVYAASGEVVAQARWMRANAPRPFRTAVQMIDVARLRTPFSMTDSEFVRGGVRKDEDGAPVGYYFANTHPNDYTGFNGTRTFDEFTYVPARKYIGAGHGRPNVIHIFEQSRPEQSRGVSEIVAGLKELRITKTFRGVQLQNAVVNAMFAATIESELDPMAIAQTLGANNNTTLGAATTDYMSQYLAQVAAYTSSSKNLMMDGVRIPHLPPGSKLNMLPAGKNANIGQDFEKSLIRYLAAIMGVSYEQLSRDYSDSNYASARAAMTETWKFMMSRKKMVADRMASTIFRLWFEEEVGAGRIEAMKYKRLPNLYDGMNFDAYTAGEWVGAARGQIDELKETQAAVLRMKYHLSSLEDESAKLGKDYRKVLAQKQREKEEMEKRGLVVDESNAINAASGAPREAQGAEKDGQDTKDGSDGADDADQ